MEDGMSRRAALAGAALSTLAGPAVLARVTVGDRAARDYARRIVEAQRTGGRVPPATHLESGMNEARAYAYQQAVVAAMLRRDGVAGIKGGAMNASGRLRLGGGPIFGVLFKSGAVASGATLRLSDYRRLLVETEIGFELGRCISEPIPDVPALRRHIAAVRPMFELPDNPLEGDGSYTAIDLIASNVFARNFIAGPRYASFDLDLDELRVRLTINGDKVHESMGRDTYGDQWSALLWLVNNAVRRRVLPTGCLILTGALGGAVPAKIGEYRADFGPLGTLSFTVAA